MENKKIALVTGVAGGIGGAVARLFLENGFAVVGMDVAPLSPFENEDFTYFTGDLSDKASRENYIKTAVDKYGKIDTLVNVAGVAPKVRGDLLEMTEESYDFVMNINTKGTLFLTQAVAKVMIENPSDKKSIVNISSMSAYTSSTTRGEYCISKAGISMVTQLFAHRLAEIGIPVFEIQPGIIRTDMTHAVTAMYEERIAARLTPTRRMGEPEDVAKCAMVCADGSLDFATGQVIEAGGGFHIHRL